METLTFETGVSDHHKLIGTMLRSTFVKGKPKKMFYRCYKNFDSKRFEEELQKQLLSVSDFESFHFAFLSHFKSIFSFETETYAKQKSAFYDKNPS